LQGFGQKALFYRTLPFYAFFKNLPLDQTFFTLPPRTPFQVTDLYTVFFIFFKNKNTYHQKIKINLKIKIYILKNFTPHKNLSCKIKNKTLLYKIKILNLKLKIHIHKIKFKK
jgi:hypothetical protein